MAHTYQPLDDYLIDAICTDWRRAASRVDDYAKQCETDLAYFASCEFEGVLQGYAHAARALQLTEAKETARWLLQVWEARQSLGEGLLEDAA